MGNERQDDRFSRLMFGDRRESIESKHNNTQFNPTSLDIESILDNINKLRDSSQNLKPLLQMVYPFVEGFIKKK
jgi:hypothetical protein